MPKVAGQTRTLSCSQGSWARLTCSSRSSTEHRRAISYQWLRNERPIPGATASSYVATEVGDYACRVTAANGAGPTRDGERPDQHHRQPSLGKAALDTKKGTAKLPVATSGSGVVSSPARA